MKYFYALIIISILSSCGINSENKKNVNVIDKINYCISILDSYLNDDDKNNHENYKTKLNYDYLPSINKSVLKNHIIKSGNLKDYNDIKLLDDLLNRSYETEKIPVNNTKYGFVFHTYPEVMVHLEDVNGKSILEIAGGDGINAILLLLMGAKQVTVNDLDPTMCSNCQSYINKLSQKMQNKIEVKKGNFFDISIENKYDMILMRNFFHFLNDLQLPEKRSFWHDWPAQH